MQDPKTQELGTAPVARLLLKTAVPSMIASLVHALYNIVDRLYIGRAVSSDAMAGLVITLPVMIALSAFGVMVGGGSNTLLSIRLGAHDKFGAEKVVGQCVALKIFFATVIPALAYVLMDQILKLFGATPEAIPYAKSYLNVILLGCVFNHLSYGFSGLIIASGKSQVSMALLLAGTIANMILDPIFIFGGLGMPWLTVSGHTVFIDFGLPQMGIAGAAWATNLSMMLATAIGAGYLASHHSPVKLRLGRIRLYRKYAWKVLVIGLSPAIMQIVLSLVTSLYNHAYIKWAADSAEATRYMAAIGIINGVHIFALMPAHGVSMAAQPIMGYNLGAAKLDRLKRCMTAQNAMSTVFCITMFIILYVAAPYLSLAFIDRNTNPELFKTTVWGMRILAIGFPFYGPIYTLATFYQSVGRAKASITINMLRQIIILLPLIIVLPYFYGIDGVWYSQPTADTLAAILSAVLLIRERRRIGTS